MWQYVEGKTRHIEVNYTNSTSDNNVGDDAVLTSVYFRYDSVSLLKSTHLTCKYVLQSLQIMITTWINIYIFVVALHYL